MRVGSHDDVIMQLSPKSSATFGFERSRTHTHTSFTAPSMTMSDPASSARQYAPRPHRVPSQQSGGSSRQRYAAGSTFFNYETFGSLRPGQDWVRLFHPRYVGLAVHVTVCGFAFYFFSYGYGRLIAEYLKANDEAQVQAAHYVLVWPQALSLIIGLLSDCFPINGFRRKPYMIMGWLISIAMYVVIIIMDAYGNSGRTLYRSEWKNKFDSGELTDNTDQEVSPYGIAYLLVSLVAAFGIQICWLAAISLSVEFAQREQLFHRGRLQATLVTLYYAGGVIANFVTACVIGEGVNRDHLVSSISVGDAAAILAVVSAIPLPFVLYYFYEEPFVNTTRVGMSVAQRLKNFWKFCHQNVVYRVLFFIILHLFLVGLYNQNVRDAVQRWSGVTRKEALAIECTRMAAMMFSILFWMVYLRNVNWRKLAFWGSVFYIAVYAVLTMCAAFDWIRNEWFYGVMLSAGDVPRAWLILYAIILATEISDIGHEGVTVALGMSYQTLAGLAGYTLAAIFPGVIGYKVTMDDVDADAPETRASVIKAFFIIAAINLTSFPLIRILPQQKLDAQQMRAFGGYNRYASTALLLTFAVLLLFNLGINLVIVLR